MVADSIASARGAPPNRAGYISDESDYYGDDSSVAYRAALENDASPSTYPTYRARLPAALAHAASRSPACPATTPRNPFEGQRHCARQLDESAAAFAQRLRPSAAGASAAGPWLWIADPCAPHRSVFQDRARLLEEGEELLRAFTAREKKWNKVKTRETLKEEILALAKATGVTSGKWLLRPLVADVDRAWATVAEGVAAGRLGASAKVATLDRKEEDVVRVICVYTYDFGDMADVRRVLAGMVALGLVGKDGLLSRDDKLGIWYKCDAYSHLGIESKNDWGLRASIYGSKEMMKGKA